MSAPSSHYQLIEQEYSALFQEFKSFAPHAGVVFTVLGVLGEGGMGKVLKVRDERLGRLAALKLLLNSKQSEQSKELFLRESQIMSWLDHPSIPPVYEWGCTANGEHYLLMRLVDGATLTERIEQCHKGKVSREALRTLLENLVKVSEAVAYAHSMGFLHRDLKPDNIMVGPFGEVLVMDWGLAKDLQGRLKNIDGEIFEAKKEGKLSFGLSEKSGMVGTIGYMSPEQANSEKTDSLSDVFALGVILTKLLTNKDAIAGENGRQMLFATVAGRIRSPRQLLKSAPRELDSLAVKAMAHKREDRIQSAEAFGKELEAYLAGQRLSVHNYSLAEKLGLWIRNHVTLAFVALLLILLISLSGLLRAWVEQSKVEARKRLALAEEETRRKALVLEQEKRKLVVAEQEKGFAERAAYRAKRVLDLFNQAKELGRRELKKDEVQRLVEEAIELAGRNETALMTAADVYDNAGFIAPLKRVLQEAVDKHPPALAALYYLHWIEVRADSVSRERYWRETPYLKRFIEESHKVGEENEYTLMAKAFDLEKEGKYKDALRIYDRIEGLNSQFRTLYLYRGNIYLHDLRDYSRAVVDYTKTIELNSNFVPGFFGRAQCHYLVGKYAEALEDFEQALSVDPKNGLLVYWKVLVLNHLERKKEALEVAEKALQMDVRNFDLQFALASALAGLGKWKEALKHCEKANQLNSKVSGVQVLLGNVKRQLGRLDEAIAHWQKAVNLRPDWFLAYFNRAVGFQLKGQYERAFQDYSKSLSLNPYHLESYYQRARVQSELKNDPGMLADLSKAIELNPDYGNPYFPRAYYYAVKKRFDLAEQDCVRYRKLIPTDSSINYVEGLIHYGKGQRQKALQSLTQFIKEYPSHKKVRHAEELIEALKEK